MSDDARRQRRSSFRVLLAKLWIRVAAAHWRLAFTCLGLLLDVGMRSDFGPIACFFEGES